MRSGEGGMEYILQMMKKFSDKHKLHIDLYGDDNESRLTGKHETTDIHTFSFGIGNRAASFRIPT
jgi:glutamine synthetase